MLIWSDQMSAPARDLPLPEARPRGREDELEPVVEVLDDCREPFGLGAGGGESAVDVLSPVRSSAPGSVVIRAIIAPPRACTGNRNGPSDGRPVSVDLRS